MFTNNPEYWYQATLAAAEEQTNSYKAFTSQPPHHCQSQQNETIANHDALGPSISYQSYSKSKDSGVVSSHTGSYAEWMMSRLDV
jgi:hypothetical protein